MADPFDQVRVRPFYGRVLEGGPCVGAGLAIVGKESLALLLKRGRESSRLRCRSALPHHPLPRGGELNLIGLADITDVDSSKHYVIVDFVESADLERKDPLLRFEWCLR